MDTSVGLRRLLHSEGNQKGNQPGEVPKVSAKNELSLPRWPIKGKVHVKGSLNLKAICEVDNHDFDLLRKELKTTLSGCSQSFLFRFLYIYIYIVLAYFCFPLRSSEAPNVYPCANWVFEAFWSCFAGPRNYHFQSHPSGVKEKQPEWL